MSGLKLFLADFPQLKLSRGFCTTVADILYTVYSVHCDVELLYSRRIFPHSE